jgi:anti-sigma regulatory factor (Ser/Thr protein kinase)
VQSGARSESLFDRYHPPVSEPQTRVSDVHAAELPSVTGRSAGFRHDAVFYRGEPGFLPSVLPFVSDAIRRDEPVLVATLPPRADALRAELGDRAARVEFVDMQAAGRNPACIIPVWNAFVARHAGSGRALNGVGEPIWAERTTDEVGECQRHESLLNLAFASETPFALICPYDALGLPSHVLEAAHESHPHVVRDGRRQASDTYQGIDGIEECDPRPLASPPDDHASRTFEGVEVTALRHEVRGWALEHGLEPCKAADLAVAVHEAAVNSVVHGGGRGVLRSWVTADAATCEVADAGRIRDPLAGRSLAPPDSPGGRGLWLINHLCDLVQIRATSAGTVVRMHQRLS